MNVICQVIECEGEHDSQIDFINERAEELARQLEIIIGSRNTFCDCQQQQIISINAESNQTKEITFVNVCEHFAPQYRKCLTRIEGILI